MDAGARTDIGPPPPFMATGPAVGFGAWAAGGGGWGPPGAGDAAAREAAVRHALDRGVTFFDTAPSYGNGASEMLLGRVLGGRRDAVTIATKVGPRDDPQASVEASLGRLRTEYVDLLQLHEALDGWESQLEALAHLQAAGKARAIGLSNATHLQIRRARELAPIATYQGAYNLFDRDVEERELPLCRTLGLGFLAYRPLASGLLTGKYAAPPVFGPGDHRRGIYWFQGAEFERRWRVIGQLGALAEREGLTLAGLAVAWVYSQPGVTVVLVGARSAEQVDENLAGARLLTPATRAAIDRLVGEAFRPARATAEGRAQAVSWGERERFIVERLDGRTRYEQIAAEWTARGQQPMITAQIRVLVDRLRDRGLVAQD